MAPQPRTATTQQQTRGSLTTRATKTRAPATRKGGFAETCGNEFYNFDGYHLCANCANGHGKRINSCIDLRKHVTSEALDKYGYLQWRKKDSNMKTDAYNHNCFSCTGQGSSTRDPKLHCWCWGIFPNPGGLPQLNPAPSTLHLNKCIKNDAGHLKFDC
jgi:hypothetical protein